MNPTFHPSDLPEDHPDRNRLATTRTGRWSLTGEASFDLKNGRVINGKVYDDGDGPYLYCLTVEAEDGRVFMLAADYTNGEPYICLVTKFGDAA
jgi:hypothetical protein